MILEKQILSKEVCQKCYANKGWIWTGENENEWNKKQVVRCIGYTDRYNVEPIFLRITVEHSLDNCQYKFEHNVLCQEEGDNVKIEK